MTERDAASVSGADTAGDPPAGEADDAAPASLGAQASDDTAPITIRPVRAPIAGLRQRMESTAALRRSLAAKEAEALDLRASIERLRREWNDERGGSSADRPVPARSPTQMAIDTPNESTSPEPAPSESAQPQSAESESAQPESAESESAESESAEPESAESEALLHSAPEQTTGAGTQPTPDIRPALDTEPTLITRTTPGQREPARPPAPRSGGPSAGAATAGPGGIGAATFGSSRSPEDATAPTETSPGRTATPDSTVVPDRQDESPRRPRRWVWLSLALLLVVLLLLLVSRCGEASTGTSAGGTATAGASATGQSTSDAVPGAVVAVPNGTPSSGPGLDEPGTHAEASVGADQTSIQVYESAILPNAATDPLVFSPTPVSADLSPTVQDLVAELDGGPVQGIRQDDGSWTVPVPEDGYTRVVLGYRLADAVVVNQPAKAGRAAAVITPLTAQLSSAAGTPVQVRTADPQVIRADCPFAPPAEWLCAGQSDGAWTATLPASSSKPVVSLLLNLAS